MSSRSEFAGGLDVGTDRAMASRISQLTLDVQDLNRQAAFWSEVLGLRADQGEDGAAKLYPQEPASAPVMWLQPVTSGKVEKLRLHLDLRPDNGNADDEVARLLALGATRTDVGQQDDDPFIVLADPEGNEFCVLRTDPR